ncbi:MAG: hypothetical protein V1686_01105 [Patescibacteria group bacterium]
MNLKNSWKEFRIWLGWRIKIIVGTLFAFASALMLISAIILEHGTAIYEKSRLCFGMDRYAEVIKAASFAKISLPLCYLAIFLMSMVAVALLISNTSPDKNWRLVIDDATQFVLNYYKKLTTGQANRIMELINWTKKNHNGRELDDCIEELKKVLK